MRSKNLLRLMLSVALVGLVGWYAPTRAVTVSGTVTDTEGAVVAGALVKFMDEADPSQVFSDSTDAEGRYEVVLSYKVAVEEDIPGGGVPEGCVLLQSYPNPFNPFTIIPYRLDRETPVRLMIYNVLGQPVRTLVDERQGIGWHQVLWDGRDDRGIGLSAGVYISGMKAGGVIQTRKMVLLDGPMGGLLDREARLKPLVKWVQALVGHSYTVSITGEGIESFFQRGISVMGDMPLDFVVERLLHTGKVATFSLPGGATMEMVWIEPGTFVMGEGPLVVDAPWHCLHVDEGPEHGVRITKGFWLGKYELTQGQWTSVMGTSPWSGDSDVQENASCPAACISWDDVQALLAKVAQAEGWRVYRLPTEAEWEYACRAGTTTRWSFGDDESKLKEYAWYEDNACAVGECYAHAVGTKVPNPWGLYDMYGNVCEWCQDWHGLYTGNTETDPTGPSTGLFRVMRGGRFVKEEQFSLMCWNKTLDSTIRYSHAPEYGYAAVGVRLVRPGLLPADFRPFSDAGPDQSAPVGTEVTLDGSGSGDADGDALTFRWSQMGGPSIVLRGATTVRPTFTPMQPGVYKFSLIVSDGSLDSEADETVVVVPSGEAITVRLPGGATMEMVWIDPGTFMMGSAEWGPEHQVRITKGFWLGKYELTQGQWTSVMGTRPWSEGQWGPGSPNHPAVYISWKDVQAFIAKLNEAEGSLVYRLPTEAEWEYACRAGTTTTWSFGDDESKLKEYAWYSDIPCAVGGECRPHAVGTKLPNPWGLYDMHGNVLEWVQDWYGEYTGGFQTDPAGPPTGSYRVERSGGPYRPATASAARSYTLPDAQGYYYVLSGARLLRQDL